MSYIHPDDDYICIAETRSCFYMYDKSCVQTAILLLSLHPHRHQFVPLPFLISNFRRAVNGVFLLLGDSPGVWTLCADVSEHSLCPIFLFTRRMMMEQTGCSETSAGNIQTSVNQPTEVRKQLLFSYWLIHKSCTFFHVLCSGKHHNVEGVQSVIRDTCALLWTWTVIDESGLKNFTIPIFFPEEKHTEN